MSSQADLARKITEMEKKYDGQFKIVFDALRALMAPPTKPKRKITRFSPDRRSRFDLKENQTIYSLKGVRQGKKKAK